MAKRLLHIKTRLTHYHLRKTHLHRKNLLPWLAIFVVALTIGNYLLDLFYSNPSIMNFLERLSSSQASFLYAVQHNLGVTLILQNGNTFIYPNGLGIIVSPLCLGIEEIVLFGIMLFSFVGPSWKVKAKGLLEFGILIIFLNQFRILMLYPVSLLTSPMFAWKVHHFIFQYGTVMVLSIFFVLWYAYYVLLEEQPKRERKVTKK